MGFIKKITSLFLFLFTTISLLHAQSIGLVLSGGGAKGCTHIGVIKALEENNIPIDYISGTSMGAIVGALYAMGYTTEEMEDLLVSEKFKTWLKGDVDDKNRFFFKSDEETPEFLSFKLSFDDSLSLKPVLPSSLLEPDQLNQACIYLFSQATTACHENFDSLFVPFRCVASDIKDKKPHIHRSGNLGDAVRSSMSFPFVFKPIRINRHLMVDGGIYNNFPIDVMKREFKPDYIIGSSVSDNSDPSEKDNDPISLLEALIMNRSEEALTPEEGNTLNFSYKDVGLLDFHRAKELIQIGYDSTIAHIDEIKAHVHRSVTIDSINAKRALFNEKKPPLLFKDIIIRGVKPIQQKFLSKSFHNNDKTFDFESFRKTYFKLLSDKKIAEIIPRAIYNTKSGAYDLLLDVELNDHFRFGFGGNISSTVSNQLYISAKYLSIRRLSYDIAIDGQVGVLYDNVHFKTRLDFPSQFPFCIKIIGDINHFKYTNKQKAFYEIEIPSEAHSTEFYTKGRICIPFMLKGKLDAGIGYGMIKNNFHGLYSLSDDDYDKSEYKLGVALLQYRHNSLSHKLYPISGTDACLTAQYIFGKRSTTTAHQDSTEERFFLKSQNNERWLQLSMSYTHYFKIGKHFSLGVMAEGVYSSQSLGENYIESLMMAPAFTPTAHSKMVFNPALRANCYLAAGLNPIVRFNDIFHVRLENYLFLPQKGILPTALLSPVYDKAFSKFYGLSELTAVAQLKFISIGIYANWYSYPNKNWNAGLNIGYLIFHNKLIEK